jgi:UDPglucose 6-dehydrogenase
MPLIEGLQRAGARVKAFDPEGMRNAEAVLTGVEFCGDAYACADRADAVVVVTDWESVKRLDLARLRKAMHGAVMVDFRNAFEREVAERHGFVVTSVGIGGEGIAKHRSSREARLPDALHERPQGVLNGMPLRPGAMEEVVSSL